MGWFWADNNAVSAATTPRPASRNGSLSGDQLSACPVDHSKFLKPVCPVLPSKRTNNDENDEVLNPMNNMPLGISSERAPGQKITLSTERTISSIPRGASSDQGLWEYPSPQQMLNAMLRKGKGQDIPEDAVESMVDVHNFLNEGAWQQILDWEDKYTQELRIEPRLLKFTGRPHDLSPRAQSYLWLSKIFPNTFNSQPPFDRHDWTVLRASERGKHDEVRYVIDYYGAPDDEETGMPAFMLDTRPALDLPRSAYDRFERWAVPLWKRAMGEFEEK